MVKRRGSKRKTNAPRMRNAPLAVRAPRPRMVSNEEKLLKLIMDPCGAEMAHGYALSTEGVVQRFTQYFTPTATTETSFAYAINPAYYGPGGVNQVLGTGTGAIGTAISAPLPGQTFVDANADTVSTLAACVEVLYTGTVVNRKGYIAVAQGPSEQIYSTITTPTVTFNGLVTLSNAVAPVPSAAVSVKWTPPVANFIGSASAIETDSHYQSNSILVTAVGVNPNDFVVRVTVVYEYAPKVGLGMPLARATRVTPVGVGERITSTLDRMGHWWHNLGDAAAAASRLGNRVVYGAGQVAGFTRGLLRTTEAATTLLALAG
ncbi:hypothetical protein 2 [Changjiang tombus-like virus 12]|uniref:hypothetical protein 2 n=1 Tax=Changjiang tombus-like virus 12 TaxID=1922805 RepID=UPI0009096142|nr:hypothetical protein 2 [Changjiang tombus-like virus 12]APG76236.1 hypothetical protein 2 [Changjiang tombus-like virus 12]